MIDIKQSAFSWVKETPENTQAELNEKMDIKEIPEKINGCLAILKF